MKKHISRLVTVLLAAAMVFGGFAFGAIPVKAAPTDFVYSNGGKFMLNSQTFYYGGITSIISA